MMSTPTLALSARVGTFICVVVGSLAVCVCLPSPGAAQQRPIIVQTNAAGDNVHLIDPASQMIVGEITGVEVIHGGRSGAGRQQAVSE